MATSPMAENLITRIRSYVNEWLPLVAAARLTKNKEEEKELLEQWINVVDFQ